MGTDSDSTSSCSDVEPSVHIVEVTKSQCDGLAFVEEFTVDEPLDNEEEDEQNAIVDEPLDNDLEQDEENVIVDEPLDYDLEQDDHEEKYYDLDQDNDNEKIVLKEDQDDFEDCEENVIEVNHHESELEKKLEQDHEAMD